MCIYFRALYNHMKSVYGVNNNEIERLWTSSDRITFYQTSRPRALKFNYYNTVVGLYFFY